MDTFVNPLPRLYLWKWLSFDYPLATKWSEYNTPNCRKNIDLYQPMGAGETPSSEVPTQEGVYGKLGSPQRNQGFPCMYEHPFNEPGDPYPLDQIIDRDREAAFDHTGRLSGSFVKYLIQPNHKSIVKMTAVPLTHPGDPIPLWNSGLISIVPQTPNPNVWYWEDPAKQNELIFTAHAVLNRQDQDPSGMPSGIYNLIVNWEFWAINGDKKERMPISGFDESMTFEMSEAKLTFEMSGPTI
jgi:hypothetical protein